MSTPHPQPTRRYRAASLRQVWGGRMDAVLAKAQRAWRAIPSPRLHTAAAVTALPVRLP